MADFAQMIYGTAENVAKTGGQGVADKFIQGAELAQKQEQLNMQRQQLDQSRMQLENAKSEKMMQMYESGTKMDPKSQQVFFGKNGFFRQARDNMGMTNQIPDQGLDLLVKTPEGVARGYGAINNYRVNGGDPNDVWNTITNPMTMAEMQPYFPELNKMLSEASKERQTNQANITKAQLEVQAADTRQKNSLNHQDELKAMQELGDFGKAVANPTTRSNLGRMKSMIDSADSVKQLTDSGFSPNATKEQRVAAYNSLDSRQVGEVVKGLDRLLSQANPTVHGNEVLAPPTTLESFIAKWGEKAGNMPVGVSQGEFIDRMMGTVNRERNMNANKLGLQSKTLKEAYPLAAKVYGDKMDNIVNGATYDPMADQMVTFNGKQWTKSQLEQLIKDNPDDPKTAAAKAALGIK